MRDWILGVKELTMPCERYFYLNFMVEDTGSEMEMAWLRSCSRHDLPFLCTTLLYCSRGLGFRKKDLDPWKGRGGTPTHVQVYFEAL